MHVILVSDLHLLGPQDPNQQLFLRFLAEQPHTTTLCLLGDVFQFWWHRNNDIFPAYQELLEALKPWAGRLYFTPGNHDYHAPAYLRRALQAQCSPTFSLDFDGTRTFLAHGDACDQSAGYRNLSRILRGRAFAALMDASWPWGPWKFMETVTGGHHNGPNPTLLAIQEQLAQQELDRGHQLVVFGHTHAPGQHPLNGGTYVNLGDWVTHHTYLEIHQGIPTLKRYAPDPAPL